MKDIVDVQRDALSQTKKKVLEDVDNYLGKKKEFVPFDDYLSDRNHYLQQIWINIWLNKVTNDISKKQKKHFLKERDFEVDGVDRKFINHLFRTEMRKYEPFDVLEWLKGTFFQQEKIWKKRYLSAREAYVKAEKEKLVKEEKNALLSAINHEVTTLINQNRLLFYVYIRRYVADQLVHDLNNKKYRSVDTFRLEEELIPEGSFDDKDYVKLEEFLYELTGSVQKTMYWEYETYRDTYEQLIQKTLSKDIAQLILDQLSNQLKKRYRDVFQEDLSLTKLYDVCMEQLYDFQGEFHEKIAEEYVSDLLTVAAIPFDEETHKELYKNDLKASEERDQKEQVALQQKEEAEERMLDDIFGREYSPSLGRNSHYVLHIGETNTGKTHQALERMKQFSSGIYLAPLRLLALEVYDKLNADGIPCALKTGEEEKDVEDATHVSCTVEMFHERDFYDVMIIDEAQMVADKDRGFSWYKAITKANAKEVHIIGSRNAKEMVLELLGDADIDIREYRRDVPLKVEPKQFRLKHASKGDALVCFSRKRVLETASILENAGHSVSMIYGSMPPETRKKQMQRFINKETSVIVSTDAIGMGLNLPIRRIVFLENEKFDGTRRRRLTSPEIKQIAGRAGRKGIYNIGKVAFTSDINMMARLLEKEDDLVHTFTVAPTNTIFERFQRYSRNLGYFFELWDKFSCPEGTKKASLSEERDLYRLIKNTEIEARFSLMDLYGFLHLPFSKKEPELTKQWKDTMNAIVEGKELPEPRIKKKSLEDLELSYKALGLHLLFLYRLGKRTEALYWERIRLELSDDVHEQLKTDVKKIQKKCKRCGRNLPLDFKYPICDACHWSRRGRKNQYDYLADERS
ncbi:helicase-related protein [Salipaludibacillus daqingensis]|uniref:helicase-related protein n=1 Tax=Salipaludibacillus daqingensis TaxID=3041001 RepID=UPI002476BDCF|nr:helicase-related protein [Salipaludibacillus daqingensis]